MKKYLFIIIIIFILLFNILTAGKNLKLPKNIKVISQSCTMVALYINSIDLENNELIVLEFCTGFAENYKLVNIIRTGIKVDPKTQMSFQGKDAPFQQQKL